MSYSLSATINRLDTTALHAAVAAQGPQDDATAITGAVSAVETFLTSGAWGNDSASVSVSGGESYLSLSLTRIAAAAPVPGAEGNPNVPQVGPTTTNAAPEEPAPAAPDATPAPPAAPETPAEPDSGTSDAPQADVAVAEAPAATPGTAAADDTPF